MSQDRSQILLEGSIGYQTNGLIYIKNFNVIDTLAIEETIFFKLLKMRNEIIYFKPNLGGSNSDQIYKYSFLDSSTTLIADSLYRFTNWNEIMSGKR